jgi:spermidine synthase
MLVKSENRIQFSLFILGFTSIITQIVFLRDLLTIYNGNELVTGIILANWMLLTGFGSYLGKIFENPLSKSGVLYIGHILLGILPFVMLFLTYYFRNTIFPPGKIINLAAVFFNSLLVLSPFCLLTGYLFPALASALSYYSKSNVINKAYSIEALGSLIGGLLFNFLLLFVLETFNCLIILMMINLTTAIFNLYVSGKKKNAIVMLSLSIISIILLTVSNIDHRSLRFLYPNQEVIYYNDTPFGKLVVTRTGNQYNFFDNGNILYSGDNIIAKEESVHFGMVQHPAPTNVLLISGGIKGTIQEILKYKVLSVDYLEQNPEIIKAGEFFLNNIPDDSRVKVIQNDARIFLKKNKEKKYDMVLINLPDPSNAQINRYYTIEFFEELKKDLNERAVISVGLSPSSNYIGEESRKINSSVFLTLKLLFENVLIVRGDLNYFIASNGRLSSEITELIEIRKINNEYVNKNYFNDKAIAYESQIIEDAISEEVAINYDFRPVVYFYQMQYWLSHFDINYFILIGLILFPIIYSILKLNFINFGVFITGFSASSVEVILIIAFQVIYGYTYQMLGIIITFFMAGLLIGSVYLINKISFSLRTYSFFQYLIGIYSIFIALVLFLLKSLFLGYLIYHLIFILLITGIGVLTGIQFSLSTKLRNISVSRIASSAYASDLLGAAIGAVIVAAFLIPYFGIIKVSLLIAIINFITGLYILLKLKK